MVFCGRAGKGTTSFWAASGFHTHDSSNSCGFYPLNWNLRVATPPLHVSDRLHTCGECHHQKWSRLPWTSTSGSSSHRRCSNIKRVFLGELCRRGLCRKWTVPARGGSPNDEQECGWEGSAGRWSGAKGTRTGRSRSAQPRASTEARWSGTTTEDCFRWRGGHCQNSDWDLASRPSRRVPRASIVGRWRIQVRIEGVPKKTDTVCGVVANCARRTQGFVGHCAWDPWRARCHVTARNEQMNDSSWSHKGSHYSQDVFDVAPLCLWWVETPFSSHGLCDSFFAWDVAFDWLLRVMFPLHSLITPWRTCWFFHETHLEISWASFSWPFGVPLTDFPATTMKMWTMELWFLQFSARRDICHLSSRISFYCGHHRFTSWRQIDDSIFAGACDVKLLSTVYNMYFRTILDFNQSENVTKIRARFCRFHACSSPRVCSLCLDQNHILQSKFLTRIEMHYMLPDFKKSYVVHSSVFDSLYKLYSMTWVFFFICMFSVFLHVLPAK